MKIRFDMNLRMFERWIFINVNFHFSTMHSNGPVGYGYLLVIFTRVWSRWVCIQVECVTLIMLLIWGWGLFWFCMYLWFWLCLLILHTISICMPLLICLVSLSIYVLEEGGGKSRKVFWLGYIFALK